MQDTEKLWIDSELSAIGDGGLWLWYVFLLASAAGFNNAFHNFVYVFIGAVPQHWCKVPELVAANWTSEQVRNVSIPQ